MKIINNYYANSFYLLLTLFKYFKLNVLHEHKVIEEIIYGKKYALFKFSLHLSAWS